MGLIPEVMFRTFAGVSFIIFVSCATFVRNQIRNEFEIRGNALEDLFSCLLMWPNVALQLDVTTASVFDVSDGILHKFEQDTLDRFESETRIINNSHP